MVLYEELTSTTADISVRVCRDQAQCDDDLTLTVLELYFSSLSDIAIISIIKQQ